MKKFRREIPTIYRQSKISSTASFLSCKIRRSLSKQLTSELGKTSVKTSMARKYCRSVKRKGVVFDWLWYWWRNLRCNMSTFPLELFLSVDCLLRNFSIIFYIWRERERETSQQNKHPSWPLPAMRATGVQQRSNRRLWPAWLLLQTDRRVLVLRVFCVNICTSWGKISIWSLTVLPDWGAQSALSVVCSWYLSPKVPY